ncbi:MAG: DMT family transporter, partial [Lachnospiraceae bacterium]|nr:DMT family transporter [Lachnospiraceae bacterium]
MDKDKFKIIISCISFGMIGTVSRFIPLSEYTLVFYRAMLASLSMLLYVVIAKKPFRMKVIKENIKLLMLATFGIVFNWLFMFMAFNTCTVPVATVSMNTLPIFLLIAATIFFKEKMNIKNIICIIISTIGIIFISNVLYTGFKSKEILGVMYGVLTAILTTIAVMANKKLEKVNAYEKIIFEFFT